MSSVTNWPGRRRCEGSPCLIGDKISELSFRYKEFSVPRAVSMASPMAIWMFLWIILRNATKLGLFPKRVMR